MTAGWRRHELALLNKNMAESKGPTAVTLLLPNGLYDALQAKLAHEQKDLSEVAIALLQHYVNEANRDVERRLTHVEDIMGRYDLTLRALATDEPKDSI